MTHCTCWVICTNDYPHTVVLTSYEDAEQVRRAVHSERVAQHVRNGGKPDQHLLFTHIREVPLCS